MSSTDALDGQDAIALNWSDPLIGLQFEQFQTYLIDLQQNDFNDNDDVEVAAEYLCEWSRNLLNRSFGRTTQQEINQLSELFDIAATLIIEKSNESSSNSKKIKAYVDHIRQRTGLDKKP